MTPPESDRAREPLPASIHRVMDLMDANDRRYGERFLAGERAIELGLKAQQDLVSAAFQSSEKAVRAALEAADRATAKAEIAAEKRFESINEFRGTLADQQRMLITREEANLRFTAAEQRIAMLERRLESAHSERVGALGGWGYAVGVVGLVLALAAFFAK